MTPGVSSDVGPSSVGRFDGEIVRDREAVVRRGREEREEVDRRDQACRMSVEESMQRLQRRFAGLLDLVGVGDEKDVPLRDRPGNGWWRDRGGALGQQIFEARSRLGPKEISVDPEQMFVEGVQARHLRRAPRVARIR
jgi:hypothetical protein